MSKHSALFCAIVVGISSVTTVAHASYEDQKNKQNMDIIQRAIAKFRLSPAVFDGKRFKPGTSLGVARGYFSTCNHAIKIWNKHERQVSKKGKKSQRFGKLRHQMQLLVPACKQVWQAAKAYEQQARGQAQARAKSRSANKAKCEGVEMAARKAVGMGDLLDVLDISFHNKTLASAEHVKAFRAKLNKLAPVCARPQFKGSVRQCKGVGMLTSSATNARYDSGDICAPAIHPNKTLTDIVMRLVALNANTGNQDAPSVDQFRSKDGWIHSENPVYYASFFRVDDAFKKRTRKEMASAFAAAGVPAPSDFAKVWAKKQAYFDALKVAVDATAGEWKLGHNKCKGYGCGLAKRAIKKGYKGAAIKGVFGRPWKIAKNSLGIPTHRYQGLWVIFKVKGEPYCQVRSLTATEKYRGGGRFRKAHGTSWGYARFQKTCK